MTAIRNWHVNCDGDQLPGGRAERIANPEWRPGDPVLDPLAEGCDWWYDSGDSRTASDARRAAQTAGWTRRRIAGQDLDLCPACAAKAADADGVSP